MLASGASAPDCSTSSVVSPEPAASLTGPDPPSTFTSEIRLALVLMPSVLLQKNSASDGVTLASVTLSLVVPAPVAQRLYSGSRLYWLGGASGVSAPVCSTAGFTPDFSAGVCASSLPKVG